MKDETPLRIKSAIEESGLTLYELQHKTKISKSAIQRYATGATDKIPIDALKKIADATGVSPSYLMGWENDKKTVRNIFSMNLKKYMRLNNTTVNQLVEITGKSAKDITSWLDSTAAPTLIDVNKIADYYGISAEIFENSSCSHTETISDEEYDLLKMYRDMTTVNKVAVFNLVKNLSENK